VIESERDGASAASPSLRAAGFSEEAGQERDALHDTDESGTKASAAETVQDSAAAGKVGTRMSPEGSVRAVRQAEEGSSSSSEEDVGMAQKVGFGRKSLSSVRDKRKPALRKVTKRGERQVLDDGQPPVERVVATSEDAD
jgi:hypothetical protein